MTSYVQSASSSPTARDLLDLLKGLTDDDLAKPVAYWDEDGYTEWHGVVEVVDDEVRVSYDYNDASKAEFEAIRRANEAARLAERMDSDDYKLRAAELEALRQQGLLPPGA